VLWVKNRLKISFWVKKKPFFFPATPVAGFWASWMMHHFFLENVWGGRHVLGPIKLKKIKGPRVRVVALWAQCGA